MQNENHILWHHVPTSASYESRNAVVMAIVSATYNHLWVVLQYVISQSGAEMSLASTSDLQPNPVPTIDLEVVHKLIVALSV